MSSILFFIHDLGQGGAEKVLVNLVNNMDPTKFDITVMTLFDVGVNRQFLKPHITYKYVFKKVFRGNSHILKLLSPEKLHKLFIKEKYDIEVAYLEGPCARIISGCKDSNTKLISWIHIQQKSANKAASSFRSIKEATTCYNRFHQIVCVSKNVQDTFIKALDIHVPVDVYYNTNESDKIVLQAQELVEDITFAKEQFNIVAVGKLLRSKGFDRLLQIINRLVKEKYSIHLYILGIGPLQNEMEQYIKAHDLKSNVTLLGYQTNPYKYVAKCDLFVCASHAEGFSTAATEALIVGTPICTVEVAGMREMLGENNEYGVIVANNDDSLYEGIKSLIENNELLQYYKAKAIDRGKDFSTTKTVDAIEKMLLSL